jgi:adenylate cyclase
MFELAFIQIVAGCLVGVALTGLRRAHAARRRRWMARHPAPTFVFADLVGYTALTEEYGDETAARVAREFRRTISGLSREHGAWQVKSMGDGAMIWAPDAAGAVALAARLVEEVGIRPDLLPVRVGVHTGPVVMLGGDWYGSAVNVAARLAGEATANEALISWATRRAAHDDLNWSLRHRCEIALRGVERPIAVWSLKPSAVDGRPALAGPGAA